MTGRISADHTVIQNLARRHGCTLIRIVTVDDDTFMPTAYIVGAAADARATVVIAPDIDHFGVGYKAIPHACAVLLPTGLIPRQPERKP